MRFSPARWVVAVVFLVLPHTIANAQTPPPAPSLPRISQDVFVTATVSELDGAPPRTTAVLTRDDLQRIGITSVIEGLRLIPASTHARVAPAMSRRTCRCAARRLVRASCSWTGSG